MKPDVTQARSPQQQHNLRRQVLMAVLGFAGLVILINLLLIHLIGQGGAPFVSPSHQALDGLLLVGTVVVSVLVVSWLLNRLVFRRLDSLRAFVEQLENTPYTPARLRLEGRSDELKGAAEALNRLLDRLNTEHDQQRAQSDVLRLIAENASMSDVLGIIRDVLDRRHPGAQAALLPTLPTGPGLAHTPNIWTVAVRGRAGERYGQLQLTFAGVLPEDITSEAAWMAELLGVAAEQERLRRDLSFHAYHDELTGLLNRQGVLRALKSQLEHEDAPHAGAPLAVLHLNIDRFKRVNDLLGHAAGDDLLCQTAELLKARTQLAPKTPPTPEGQPTHALPGAVAARLGADEFILAVANLHSEAEVDAYTQALCAKLNEPRLIQGQVFQPSVSVGLSLMPRDATDAESLLRYAALATEHSKRSGQGVISHFVPALHDALIDRLQLEHDLRDTLREGGLSLVYQPQVGLPNNDIIGFEALLRWQHPRRGLISPTTFIPVAEEAGLITEVGHWVLRQAAQQAAQWRAQGISVPIAVNISAAQLLHADIVPRVQDLLTEYALPPQALTLEVTESLLMHGAPGSEAHANLGALAALGLSVAVDDFGTGYSSLSYLHRLPIQTVKVDRSFVNDLPDSPEATRIVETIIRLSHQLNLDVLAEGVERPEQAALLGALGCTGVQGYLYARPMAAHLIPEFLVDHSSALTRSA